MALLVENRTMRLYQISESAVEKRDRVMGVKMNSRRRQYGVFANEGAPAAMSSIDNQRDGVGISILFRLWELKKKSDWHESWASREERQSNHCHDNKS